MRCSKAQEFLSLQLDGCLPADATRDLQEHLDACGGCREYRQDLQLGSRLLAATEPALSENFDWKLQLRLNQALRETAGEVAYPWTEEGADRWGWLRNFGASAAVGLAAVLAVAVFLTPGRQADRILPDSGHTSAAVPTLLGGDRLPLENRFSTGDPGRAVSTGSPFGQIPSSSRSLYRGWSGGSVEDLRTINALRAENEKLQRMVFHTQRQMQLMQAQLDSADEKALDLGEGKR